MLFLFAVGAAYAAVADCALGQGEEKPVAIEQPLATAQVAACLGSPLHRQADIPNAYRIVDVRSARAFRTAHVKGAINLPVTQVNTRAFLRDSPLMLMGGDGDVANLVRLCVELREEGEQAVFVEPDGIYAGWAAERLERQSLQSRELSTLSPAEFHRAGQSFSWAALVVAEKSAAVPEVVATARLEPTAPPHELGPLINGLLDKVERVLVVDGGDIGPRVFAASIPAERHGQVRLLSGGLEAYRQYAAMNRALHSDRRDGLDETLTCQARR